MFLDSKLNFFDHINLKIENILFLARSYLLARCTSFLRPHLNYGGAVYDQPNNSHLSDNIQTVQYNAALAVTGAVGETSNEKLYQDLGLESLKDIKNG